MKRVLLLFIILILSGCGIIKIDIVGQGDVVSHTTSIDSGNYKLSIKDIDLYRGGIDIVVVESDDAFIRISTHQNIYDDLEIKVLPSVIIITGEKNHRYNTELVIEFSNVIFEKLDLQGGFFVVLPESSLANSFSLSLDGAIEGEMDANNINDNFALEVNGAAKLEINNLDNEILYIKVNGAISVEGNGNTNELELHLSGSGNINLVDLISENANIKANGTFNMLVNVTTLLELSGGGMLNLSYASNPQINKDFGGVLNQKNIG